MNSSLYAFTLGREWKISLAELLAIFPVDSLFSYNESFAIFSLNQVNDADIVGIFGKLWGSIRVIKILTSTSFERFATDVLKELESNAHDGKITFALGAYGWESSQLSDIGMRMKKTLANNNIKSRLVNSENKNIHSAAFKWEKLGKSKTEYNLLTTKDNESYLGVTLACQDIDDYARRDTGKQRDMIVGMLPPKLARMMINLTKNNTAIYDPFCGLGTVLIEALHMGRIHILASDISEDMVLATEKNTHEFIETEKVWHERIKAKWGTPKKDMSIVTTKTFHMDAKNIGSLSDDLTGYGIVSEWYLGEIMHTQSITLDKVMKQRKNLSELYEAFFSGLKKKWYKDTIVMTFPFWDIAGKYSFFSEVHEILEKHGFLTLPLIENEYEEGMMTRKWTLLYKRPGQNVGREIWRGKLQ